MWRVYCVLRIIYAVDRTAIIHGDIRIISIVITIFGY